MKTQTLYITDLDGTSAQRRLRRFAPLHPENQRLSCTRACDFTVATARTPATVSPAACRQLDLDMPAVLMNGAVLYDIRRRRYIRANGFTDDSALRLHRPAREAPPGPLCLPHRRQQAARLPQDRCPTRCSATFKTPAREYPLQGFRTRHDRLRRSRCSTARPSSSWSSTGSTDSRPQPPR